MPESTAKQSGKPKIERVRKSVGWLRAQYKRIFGEDVNIAELTENGKFPMVYLWDTYDPDQGDGYGITTFAVDANGSPLPDEAFQRTFSKESRQLAFPSVCEIDTREPKE